jgi:hypothetical protein
LKRAGFLLAALALFVLAAWLMLGPESPRARRAALSFPRHPRPDDIERQERRRTLAVPNGAAGEPARGDPNTDPPAPTPAVDPVHAALPPSRVQVVVEAGVLRDSPLGRRLLACLSPAQSEGLREVEERTGFRPLQQLERIAIAGGANDGQSLIIAEGDFRGVDIMPLAPNADAMEALGERALLAEHGDQTLGFWDERLLLIGDAPSVRDALARLSGGVPATTLSSEAYGEIYGTLSSEMLSQLLPDELGERLRGAADRVLLHVDATDDVLLVAEVHGQREEELADLGTAIAGALSVARLQAVRENDALLADLLDESRVIPGGKSFQLEMALPLATIERHLGECAGVDE